MSDNFHRRRWFQFRLRTLLLAVAVLALGFAAIAPWLREWWNSPTPPATCSPA